MKEKVFAGRAISKGKASGKALVSKDPISFFGGVSSGGVIVENEHALKGQRVSGKVLVFPFLKGSAAGMWALYRLAKDGQAPIAMIVNEADAILTAGAIFGDIPTVDHLDQDPYRFIETGDIVTVDATRGVVTCGAARPGSFPVSR